MNDYYFMASLPMIRPGDPPPIRMEDFRSKCRERLSSATMDIVDALLDDQPVDDPFVEAWRNADTQVRNAVARQRATRLKCEAEPWLREHTGWDVRIVESVGEAFRLRDPLQREQSLTALRLTLIEEIRGTEMFSQRALLAYAMSLRICRDSQSPDAGVGARQLADAITHSLNPDPDASRTAPAATKSDDEQHRSIRP